MEYTHLKDATDIDQITILLYGKSGVQKTRLAAQVPDVLFLACDTGQYGGMLSAMEFDPLFIKVTSYGQYQNLIPELEKDAGKEWKTLVIDSITSFRRIVMRNILLLTGREVPRFDEWNLCVERMRTALNTLGALNANLIITATELVTKDEDSGRIIEGGPDLPGKLAVEVPTAVDIALHLYTKVGFTKEGKRFVNYLMSSTPDEIWVGKDRTGTLAIECPTSFDSLKHLFIQEKEVKNV